MRVYAWVWPSTLQELSAHRLLREARLFGVTDLLLLVKSVSGAVYLDTLVEALRYARSYGVRVHAWIVCFKDLSHPDASPLDSLYRGRIINVVSRVLDIDVDGSRVSGIHLDYVRFLRQSRQNAVLSSEVTKFVAEVRGAIDSVDPSLELTAATVAHRLSSARDVLQVALLYGQDYLALSSIVDALMPMAYHLDVGASTREVVESMTVLREVLPTRIVAGIQLHPSENPGTLGRAPSLVEIREILQGLQGMDVALFRYRFLRERVDVLIALKNVGAAGGT